MNKSIVWPRAAGHGRSLQVLLWHAGAAVARARPFWVALALQVLVLAAFLVVWGDGVPAMSGSVFDQFAAVHFALLALLMPWAACRLVSAGDAHQRLLAAFAGAAPPHLFAARALGLFAALTFMVASTAPLAIVAADIAALPRSAVTQLTSPALVVAAFVATLVPAVVLLVSHRLVSWAAVTALTVTVASLVDEGPWAIAVLVAAAAALVTIAIRVADVSTSRLRPGTRPHAGGL